MNEKPSKWKVFTAGIIRENPVLRLVLGCCSALAVTTPFPVLSAWVLP